MDSPKELTKEILLVLYQEETTQARQHESLRAQAATILFAVSASLLALAGTLITYQNQSREVERALFALGVILMLLAFFGSALSRKHFERSMHNFSRANAYKDCLLALISEKEIETLFPVNEREERLPLIKKLREKAKDANNEKEAFKVKNLAVNTEMPIGERPWCSLDIAADRDPQKDSELIPVDLTLEKYEVENLNPLKQEVYVTPLENVKHKWLGQYLAEPTFDLFKLWDRQYFFVFFAGLIIIGYCLTSHRKLDSGGGMTNRAAMSQPATPTPTPKARVTPTRRR